MSGQPPALADDAKAELLQASESSKLGQTVPGKDGGDPPAGQKVKSEKECELISTTLAIHAYGRLTVSHCSGQRTRKSRENSEIQREASKNTSRTV